ncbi:DNA mismatch repair protein Msh3-like isoform X1 [Acropora millepora]|uniref:DNA mismatch repair protein Msh3-like isoform X1 n=1 Tax=Acropora millepora TaxID=45264 RepID=UPI001CF273A9|nr:DNA mismatch repair protein Msh3-like isoform X1 [Acropora millepora]
MDESGNNRNSKQGKFNTKKLNLGNLRCSKGSFSDSPRRSSSKNQSQATISSFFSSKTCVQSAVKRTATDVPQNEQNKSSPGQNSKRQRVGLDDCSLQNNQEENHIDTNKDKLLIRSSTFAKLNSFKKGLDSRNLSNEMEETSSVKFPCTSFQGVISEKDTTKSSENGTGWTNMDEDSKEVEDMEIVSQFAHKSDSVSHRGSNQTSRIRDVIEKTQSNSLKRLNGRAKSPYTPLELQFLEVKSKYPDVILLVECGYRYRFFGDDAERAAEVLKIMCHLDHNFQTASIPTHRLQVHVKRLVSKGYKVGVVKQTETAALKAAGDNKSKVFTRELHSLYTRTTLVGEDMKTLDASDEAESVDLSNGYLMCIFEIDQRTTSSSGDKRIFGFVAVQPSTGDIIHDEFEDGPSFTELETRFEHIGPEEILLPNSIDIFTANFIRDYVTRAQRPGDSIRLERIPDQLFDQTASLKLLTDFFSERKREVNGEICKVNIGKDGHSQDRQSACAPVEVLLNLPKSVQSCLAALVQYLQDFKLEKILRLTSNFSKFSREDKFVKLNGQTLRNLEIFKNQTNGAEKSSLFWVINHTTTAFGRRLLKKWISQPLRNVSAIEDRLNAVTELCADPSCMTPLKSLLSQLPDLERGLCTVYHRKCTPAEFVTIAKSLVNIRKQIQANEQVALNKIESPLLKQVFVEVPNQLHDVEDFLRLVNENAAKEGDKTKLFEDKTHFPEILTCNVEIQKIEIELKNHRSTFRQVLRHPSLDYCCVAGNEFLIEVRNPNLKLVPSDWIKISATKQVSRFRTPFVEEKFKLLCQWREQLSLACHQAWVEFLSLFSEGCFRYRRAVHSMATLDCLFSLAVVAKQPGFVRPVVKDTEAHIYVKQGRHPVIDHLLPENQQFVPNDTNMSVDGNRCMIITGPNMGGKSSYIKQVALIVILAQAGSYVPAEEVELGVLDAVFTRMGAKDNIYKGQSTFMVELQETSEIISRATPKSLVILDELGRGTSTHDGTAIAYATLHHFISEISSLTLFVTHYPSLAELEAVFPNQVTNNHMAFMASQEEGYQENTKCYTMEEEAGGSGGCVPSVTFLYHLVNGAAARSYGLNVARLAGIPKETLHLAAQKSNELENAIASRRFLKSALQEILSSSHVRRDSIIHLRTSLSKYFS